jgi:hypothetical protein
VFKKFAAAGAMAAVVGGVIMGSSPAQADSDDGFGQSCSSPCSGSFCSPHCKPGHWHWGWHSGNGNGSGNSVNQVIPIQLCDTLKDIGALIGVPLHNVTILGKSYNREDAVCINGPVAGSRARR